MAVYPLLEHLLLDSIPFIYGKQTNDKLTMNLPTKSVKIGIELTQEVKIVLINEVTTSSKQTMNFIKRSFDFENLRTDSIAEKLHQLKALLT